MTAEPGSGKTLAYLLPALPLLLEAQTALSPCSPSMLVLVPTRCACLPSTIQSLRPYHDA